MPPGHPIILLKSNKFNMAAISVKRSIISNKFVSKHYRKSSIKGAYLFQAHLREGLIETVGGGGGLFERGAY